MKLLNQAYVVFQNRNYFYFCTGPLDSEKAIFKRPAIIKKNNLFCPSKLANNMMHLSQGVL